MILIQKFIWGLLALGLGSCGDDASQPQKQPAQLAPIQTTSASSPQIDNKSKANSSPEYNFDKPKSKVNLPEQLTEISAIDWLDENTMAGVQDELGIIFIFNPSTGEILETIEFEPIGDFEGLRIVGSTAWVLEAKGNIWEISDWRSTNRKIQRHKTPLKKENDAEGLCFDAATNRLLVACKESPLIDDYRKDMRAVYAFDLDSKTLSSSPVVKIDIPLIINHLDQNPKSEIHADVLKKLSKGKNLPIMPSEIAIHPKTGETFLLASDGMAVLVFNKKGDLQRMYKLSPDIFEQPEGLAFTPDGGLYISSEGRSQAATLHYFEPINN